MRNPNPSLVRSAEEAFRHCVHYLAKEERLADEWAKQGGLSAAGRRLCLALLSRHYFRELPACWPSPWDQAFAWAEQMEIEERPRLETLLSLPGMDIPPKGMADADSLSRMGFFYERLKDFEALAQKGKVKVRSSHLKRKRTGTYFTPLAISTFMARRTLAPALEQAGGDISRILSLRVIDPAM